MVRIQIGDRIMLNQFSRTELLIGKDGEEKLKSVEINNITKIMGFPMNNN